MARFVSDVEPNNSFSQPNNIGNPIGGIVIQNGNLSINDLSDTYLMIVDRPTKFEALLTPKTGSIQMKLFDGNNKELLLTRSSSSAQLLESENLQPGAYFLQASIPGGRISQGSYSLSINGNAVTSAQANFIIERITAIDKFDGDGDKADFYVTFIDDDGNSPNIKTRTIENNDDARPNFVITRSVPIDERIYFGRIRVDEEDFKRFFDDDTADLVPGIDFEAGGDDFEAGGRHDTLLGEVRSLGGTFRGRFGELIVTRGDRQGRRAEIAYRVDYQTFTSSSSPRLFSAPMTIGTGETIVGRNIGGIVAGNKQNNDITGLGGNDVIVGGAGRDTVNGGTGNDITFGDMGMDTHIGGRGRDVFVMDLDPKSMDVVKDFQLRRDRIGLSFGLNYEALSLVGRRQGTAVKLGNDVLAVLQNVRPNQLTAAHFTTIDFATVKGVEVPYLVGQ
ncbi:calcium-binding protein [Oscillatoria sp. FACHB-1407]|nr:hypothetical protein [Oscillatoria sp. FACHB-1407]